MVSTNDRNILRELADKVDRMGSRSGHGGAQAVVESRA